VSPIPAAVGIDDPMLDNRDVAAGPLGRAHHESNLGLHLTERVQPGSFDAHLSCEWYGRYVELGSASVGLNA
jgi:hypothetical protein